MRLDSIHGVALKADKDTTRSFWNDIARTPTARSLDNGIAKLWLDGRVEASLKDSVPQVNAPQAWAEGYDGKGTKVAVLDTGIDPTHPDVKDRILESKSFVPGQEVLDKNGHGTHVASTIAGSGAASDGVNKGVAPGADLIIGKVLGNEGSGEDSGIIAAMEWAKAEGADVVSMSLGSSIPDDGTDPMSQAVDTLSADGGPLFVIAMRQRVRCGHHRFARLCRQGAHRRRRRQAGRSRGFLLHGSADPVVRAEARSVRPRSEHQRRRLAGGPRHQRHVPADVRYLDGDPARRGGRGDPEAASPRLVRSAHQGRADDLVEAAARLHPVRAGHRPTST